LCGAVQPGQRLGIAGHLLPCRADEADAAHGSREALGGVSLLLGVHGADPHSGVAAGALARSHPDPAGAGANPVGLPVVS
ncbi:unnamed protein product, partial [Effrenium voratum]